MLPDIIITDQQIIKFKHTSARILAIGLILNSLYNVIISFQDITKLIPNLQFINPTSVKTIEQNLIKKAVIISLGLFTDSLYGFSLLIKPSHTIKIIHLIVGILIFIISIFIFKSAAFDQLINQLHFLPIT